MSDYHLRRALGSYLAHARIVRAMFDGHSAKSWNGLLRVAYRVALERTGSLDAVQTLTHSQIRKGRVTGRGFRYIVELDISFQSKSASACWDAVLELAQKLEAPVRVEFETRGGGMVEVLEWTPAVEPSAPK